MSAAHDKKYKQDLKKMFDNLERLSARPGTAGAVNPQLNIIPAAEAEAELSITDKVRTRIPDPIFTSANVVDSRLAFWRTLAISSTLLSVVLTAVVVKKVLIETNPVAVSAAPANAEETSKRSNDVARENGSPDPQGVALAREPAPTKAAEPASTDQWQSTPVETYRRPSATKPTARRSLASAISPTASAPVVARTVPRPATRPRGRAITPNPGKWEPAPPLPSRGPDR